MTVRTGFCLLLLAVLGGRPAAAAEPAALRGLAIDETLDGAARLADIARAVPSAATLPLIARIAVDWRAFTGDAASAALDRLDARLSLYRTRNIAVVLSLGVFPSDEEAEAWRAALRAILERSRDHIAGVEAGSAIGDVPPPVERYAFLAKLAAVQIRSVDERALVIAGPISTAARPWLDGVFARATGSYLNGVSASTADDANGSQNLDRVAETVAREVPAGFILWQRPIQAASAGSTEATMGAILRTIGSNVRAITLSGDDDVLVQALTAATHVADLIAGDLVPLDERAAGLRLGSGRVDVSSRVPHRLLYNVAGFGTYLVYGPSEGLETVDLDVSVANATNPTVRDPLSGTTVAATVNREGPNRLHVRLPIASHPLVLDFSFGAASEYTLTSEARKEALPRVEEIIFRHQQVQTAQDAVLERYTASVRIEQHFHPSPADPAYNVVTENRLFADRSGVEWQELSFWMNGAKWGSDRPPFPLLQPEKVLSLPLALRLNEDYTYRLDGVDDVNGRPAFVVRFEPVDRARALYRGTVWIDRRTYVRLKVQAVETHLSAPVVSNDETQVFEPVGSIDGREIWLSTRLDNQMVLLIAGRSVLVEREMHFTDVALNPPAFVEEREAARTSDSIMYRDTDAGLRYFVKKGGARVVSNDLTQSARAFALGADVDPSLDYPLPIGGLDILDFDFLHRDMQFALLYGGVIALGNIQKASLWGGKFDASVDFFGLAVKSNDSVFNATGEVSGARVTKIPVSTGVNLGYQLSPFQKLIARYQLRYDAYFRDDRTSPDFVVPSSGFTHGEGAGYEYRRRGYSAIVNATAYQRTTWESWGTGVTFDPATKTYVQYDAGLSKDFVFATFHTIHLNGAYFGGERLDRFSAYQFGIFDATRMHGVPSAVRFGDLAAVRGSYSFNLFEQYRLDLFLDHAIGRDPGTDGPWRHLTGLGVAANFRGPKSTLFRIDVGQGFLPDVYHGAGSTVLQILILKPL